MSQPPLPVIRRALPSEAVPYAAAAERFFRQTYGHDAAHAAIMDVHCTQTYDPLGIAAELSAPGVIALVAVSAEGIVGLAQMHPVENLGEVKRFYLDRDWQGRGLAQALMDRLIANATAANITALRLGVWTGNDRAIAFYRLQGFVPAGTVEFLLAGVPQSDLMMQRSLLPASPAAAV